jgi:hypothetical protein
MEHVTELMDSQISLAISEIMEYVNDRFNSSLVESLNNIGGEVILTTDTSLRISTTGNKILTLGLNFSPILSLNSITGLATITGDNNFTITSNTTTRNINISLNIQPVLSLNSQHGDAHIVSADSSITADDQSTANTIKLSSNLTRVQTLNGKSGIVNLTNEDGTISIDSSQPNLIRLRAIGGGGGGTAFDGNLDANLNIGNDTTNYLIN